MKEIFRDIKDFEGLYQVSNLGNVFSIRSNRLLKLTTNGKYPIVQLWINGKFKWFYVHILVAKTFPEICGEWFEGAIVNHKDCCTTNNIATNLEVCTYTYNNTYNNRHLLTAKLNSKIVLQYDKQMNFIKEWSSIKEVEISLGIKQGNISACCRGVRKSAGGYIWKYKEGA